MNNMDLKTLYEILKNQKYAGVYIFNRTESKDIAGKRKRTSEYSSSVFPCDKSCDNFYFLYVRLLHIQ